MTSKMRLRRLALAAGLLLAGALSALEPPTTTIEFAPAVVAKMQGYGENERATLEAAIRAAVAREAARTPAMAGRQITVTVEEVAPTHPTREQLASNPAVDPVLTKFLGGAELAGEVRDANQHVVAKVTHRYFAPTLALGSSSLDPWADARRAIDQFAVKLAAACRDLRGTAGRGA